MEAIRWERNELYLLDQTRLPGSEYWLRYTNYRDAAQAIRTMVVRGAPAIGVAAAYAMVLAAQEYAGAADFTGSMAQAKQTLAGSRPTAVNLFWALDRMERCWLACGPDLLRLEEEARTIHLEDIQMNAALSKAGAELVPCQARILTHCNAGALATGGWGTALGVIRTAHAQGKVSMVYADETRPLLQGARLTAYELVNDRIPVTLICDGMAGYLMAQGCVDLVVVGCDRMAANGDFANNGIPFYTALPSSTIDRSLPDGSRIPVEQRDGGEVTSFAGVQTGPAGVRTWNPSFDVTPHELLTAAITERGVLRPPFDQSLARLFQEA